MTLHTMTVIFICCRLSSVLFHEWDGEWAEVQADSETGTDLKIQTNLKHQRMTHWIWFDTSEQSTKFEILAVTEKFKFYIRPESQLLVTSPVVKQRKIVKTNLRQNDVHDGQIRASKKKQALQVFISTDKKLCKVLGKQDNKLEEIEKQIIIKSTMVCAFL